MFNTTEMNLMILYNPGTRLGLMEELGNMLGYLSGEETGLRRTTGGRHPQAPDHDRRGL